MGKLVFEPKGIISKESKIPGKGIGYKIRPVSFKIGTAYLGQNSLIVIVGSGKQF